MLDAAASLWLDELSGRLLSGATCGVRVVCLEKRVGGDVVSANQPLMAPESPGNLVVLDFFLDDGGLKCRVDRFDPVRAGESRPEYLDVSWNALEAPPGWVPAGGGAVFVLAPQGYTQPDGYRHTTYVARPERPNGRIGWKHPVMGDSLMLVMILPPGHLLGDLTDADPAPSAAKVLDGRLALYWLLKREEPTNSTAYVSLLPRAAADADLDDQARLLTAQADKVARGLPPAVRLDSPSKGPRRAP